MKDDRTQKIKKQRAYAQSMLLSAVNTGGVKEALRVRDDLNSILFVAIRSTLITYFFADDYRSNTDKEDSKSKQKIIHEVFNGACDSVLNTLCVMAEYNDLNLCLSIYTAYNELFEEYFNAKIVDVTTVVELDDHLRKVITDKVKNDLGSDVVLHEHINKKLLGGIIIVANNRILDSSLITKIEKTKSKLTSIHNYG